ncbi:VanZ family protein [Paludisphaera soli]|uniref:VanZ family protein n=1 Tax=Paludisphaera soli TaxID=2712865 RepID=UPI0013EDDC01|nr:hypothetical protein [Paludisphaera soli]
MRPWLYAAIGWTLLILGLCWMPKSVVTQAGGERSVRVPHADKIAHTGLFLGLAFLWLKASPAPRRFAPVVLGGLALAVITELGQMSSFVNRDGGLDDGLFDMIGVGLGGALFYWVAGGRRDEADYLALTEGA